MTDNKMKSIAFILAISAFCPSTVLGQSNTINHDSVYTAKYNVMLNLLDIDGLSDISFRLTSSDEQEILVIATASASESHYTFPSGRIKYRITRKKERVTDEEYPWLYKIEEYETDEYHESFIGRIDGGGNLSDSDMPHYRNAVFQGDSRVESITIPKEISSARFVADNCKGLKAVYIEDGVKAVGINMPGEKDVKAGGPDSQSTFSRCPKLTELRLPASVENISSLSNYDSSCNGFLSIYVEENNKRYKDIDGIVYSKNCDTLMYVPSARTSLDIPEGVISTDPTNHYIFNDFNFRRRYDYVSFPSTMKSIYSNVFADIIYLHSKTPYPSYDLIIATKCMYVPYGCLSVYYEFYSNIWANRYDSETLAEMLGRIKEMNHDHVGSVNENNKPVGIYSPWGIKRDWPAKGVNILRMKDGTVRKRLYR